MRRQAIDESWLMRVVMRTTTPWRHTSVPVLAGIALEVALMFGLGMIGASGVLGLPGPLAVAIAAVVGVIAKPRYAAVVAAAGCAAYLAFLSEFGRQVPYTVVAVSSLLWIGMPWLIARAGHSLRREVLARQSAQEEVEDLYHLLEQGLLPRQRAGHPHLHSATYFRPGEQRLRIGGDFFDLTVTADGSLAIVIGDVSGHGAEAGALSAKLRSAWRGSVAAGMPGADVARILHHIVSEEGKEDVHATALIAVIAADGSSMELITAGHPAPLLVAADISPLPVKHGLPLGIDGFSNAWPLTAIDLPSSWTLFFYTDGLVEMRAQAGASARVHVEGLIARLETLDDGVLTREDLRDLVDAMAAQSGAGPADDVAIVVVSGKRREEDQSLAAARHIVEAAERSR